MATNTTNYNLVKPDATDFYDISAPNGNMDIIDAALADKQNLTEDLEAETSLADADYVPFYDTSETANRKTLWSNIKAKIKDYTDTLYSALNHTHLSSSITDSDSVPTTGSTKLVQSGGVYTEILKKQPILDTAGYHNSIVRGKDITSYFTDGTLWSRINGTNGFKLFEDLYLGDYINMGVGVTAQETDQGTSYGNIGSQYVTIAGFDTHFGNGGSSVVDFHHICMVPGQYRSGAFHFGRHRMNATNTTEGGYAGSVMHTTVLGAVTSAGKTYAQGGTINEQLYRIFGSHLKTTNELLANSINATGYNRLGTNSGCSNSWAWTNCQAVLMSEVEVYGSIVWSSSGYDTGNAKTQLPLFRLEENCINNRSSYYWLKDVASAPYFANCDDNGYAYYSNASNDRSYVRPRFLLS